METTEKKPVRRGGPRPGRHVHIARRESERRMRVMARNHVAMLYDDYQWPNGKPHRDKSGMPRVSRSELLRSAGYSDTYRGRAKYRIFESEYYKTQFSLELARRQGFFEHKVDEAERVGIDPLEDGKWLLAEAMLRAKSDPGALSVATLAKLGALMVKLGMWMKTYENPSPRLKETGVKVFAKQMVMLTPEQRAEVGGGLVQQLEDRKTHLDRMILAANAIGEEDDERSTDLDPDAAQRGRASPGPSEAA